MSQPQAADASAFGLRADDSAREIRRDVPADVTSLQTDDRMFGPLLALRLGIRSPAPPLGDGDTPAAATELSLVITGAGAVVAVDARIKVAPHEPHDPFLRRLR